MSVVTAIVVVRNGERELPATLDALARQTRRPDAVVIVDCASRDGSVALAAGASPTALIRSEHRLSFGDAVDTAVRSLPAPAAGDALWLLSHDAAPEPGALEALLAELEVSPSVGVAGPKLLRADNPDYFVEFGQALTQFGATVALVHDELDQGQHDDLSDVLAVAPAGMLVRSAVWAELGGFDPALPVVDTGLDFCVRARLAGHRVSVAPAARVRFGGGGIAGASESEKWRQRLIRARQTRTAQLHRRLAYAPAPLALVHWLTLLPLAVVRSAWLLIAKMPGQIGGEFRSALAVMFGLGSVARSRRLRGRSQTRPWSTLESLRLSSAEMRRRRMLEREARISRARGDQHELRFFASGGGWTLAIAAVVSLVVCIRFLTAHALVGGGLGLLSSTLPELWNNAMYGWRDLSTGFVGPADPFALVLALLGSLTFWSPSFALVVVWLIAIPAAAMTAWFTAARLTDRGGIRALAGMLWALSPTLLAALAEGRPGPVIAHILLPLLISALLGASRSWTAAASSALLFAAITASAPSLAPALLVGWLAALFAAGRGVVRVLSVPIATAVLFAPLALEQFGRGTPLGVFADPGVPVAGHSSSNALLLLGFPTDTGWTAALGLLGGTGFAANTLMTALVAPLFALALFALFVRGSRFAAAALVLAVTGLATALAAQQVSVASVGSQTVGLWTGSALSVYWLGVSGAAVVGLRALGRFGRPITAVTTVALLALVAPLLSSLVLGASAVQAAPARDVPAYVAAESARIPGLTTLVIEPQPDGAIRAMLQRNLGATLDDQSTLAQTSLAITDGQERLAQLSADLVSVNGAEVLPELRDLGVQFILVAPIAASDETAAAARASAIAALNRQSILSSIGDTQYGALWTVASDIAVVSPNSGPTSSYGILVLTVQLSVLAATMLLALPTGVGAETRPTRVTRTRPTELGEPVEPPAPVKLGVPVALGEPVESPAPVKLGVPVALGEPVESPAPTDEIGPVDSAHSDLDIATSWFAEPVVTERESEESDD